MREHEQQTFSAACVLSSIVGIVLFAIALLIIDTPSQTPEHSAPINANSGVCTPLEIDDGK